MLSGIRQAGWDKPDNQQNGVDLAKDALNLITGYMAKNPNVPTDSTLVWRAKRDHS